MKNGRTAPKKRNILIEVTESEDRALTWLYKQQFWGDPCRGAMADWILKVALQHPEQINQWITSARKYAESEGIDVFKHFEGCIAANKNYRRVKMPVD